MSAITPEEARAYADRWAVAEAFELEELRRTPMEKKLMQLCALMASRHLFADDPEREKGVIEVRERWARLRQIGGVAASILGRARLTQDVDALVWLPEIEWVTALAKGVCGRHEHAGPYGRFRKNCRAS